jgi:hypothetical protein
MGANAAKSPPESSICMLNGKSFNRIALCSGPAQIAFSRKGIIDFQFGD